MKVNGMNIEKKLVSTEQKNRRLRFILLGIVVIFFLAAVIKEVFFK